MSFLGSIGRPKFVSGGLPRSVEDDEREERERHDQQVRAARVEVARKNWAEIDPPERLVRRPLNLLIDEETDLVYRLDRGDRWLTGKATLVSGEQNPRLAFYVDRVSGHPVVLERVGGTWTEECQRREAHRHRVAR